MSLNNMWNFPKPSDWERFEKMVCDCASQKWGKPFCIYGRKGQKQHGIDIISEDGTIAIQCKNYQSKNTAKQFEKKIQNDYEQIKKLSFKVEQFVVATSMDRDNKIQDILFSLVQNEIQIEVMFWDDICEIIASNPLLYNKYYHFLSIQKNRRQLLTLAFFGSQIAMLIGLTLGDRCEASAYCTNLRNGAVWFENKQIKDQFLNDVDNVEDFALGYLSIQDFCNYEQTEAYYCAKNIEKIVVALLENLTEDDKKYYLAGLYLGNFFCEGISGKRIADYLVDDFLTQMKEMDINEENKKRIMDLSVLMKNPDKSSDIAAIIYDQLRLVV